MIRDAVLHLLNEQPLLVDLPEAPTPSDLVLVCTNLRTTNQKRPHFVDDQHSTFVFPYGQVRFIEIPRRREPAGEGGTGGRSIQLGTGAEEPELEVDEDFLRRVREV